MGTKNRERRRHKQLQRERQRRRQADGGRVDPGLGFLPPELLLGPVVEAVHHASPDADELLGGFASSPLVEGGGEAVASCLRRALSAEVAGCRDGGWMPRELVRVARRSLGTSAPAMLGAALWAELSHQRTDAGGCSDAALALAWAAEVKLLERSKLELDPSSAAWPEQVRSVVTLIGLLGHLPRFPRSAETGRPAGNSTDDAHRRILERVRALLAKAEATTFAEEADALTAKAQELLTRHSIDRAALAGADPAGKRPTASMRRIWIDEPYVIAKSSLLHNVALANRCRSVRMGDLGLAIVAGHDDDLDTVEVLFTSLLVQATAQLTAAGSRAASGARTRSRSYRQSFLIAFATRIGQRLREASAASESAGATEHGSSLLPVLAARRSAADEAVGAAFGTLEQTRISASDRLGWAAGTAAADLANLSVHPGVAGARGSDPSTSGPVVSSQPTLPGLAEQAAR